MSHRRLRAVVRAELATSRRSLAVAALATLGSTAAALLAPWPLKIVFDHVLLAEPLPEGQGFLRPVTEAGDGVALAVPAVATLVGILAVMLALDWQLALVPLVSFPLLYVGLRRSGKGRAGEAVSAAATAAVVVLALEHAR